MKQYGVITTDKFEFDDAILEVFEQLNEIGRNNPTVTYEDIDITFGFFRRTWVVLVYSYDDEMFGQELPTEISPATVNQSKFIGIPSHIDPADPNWREHLENWRQTLSS